MAIICVGETERQHNEGSALYACREEVAESVPHGIVSVVIAYEPLWAIGSGKTPTRGQIVAMHAHIRERLAAWLGDGGRSVRILRRIGHPTQRTRGPLAAGGGRRARWRRESEGCRLRGHSQCGRYAGAAMIRVDLVPYHGDVLDRKQLTE